MNKVWNLLAHLSISLSLVLITVFIFNLVNPRMGFLSGTPAMVVAISSAVLSIITAIVALSRDTKKQGRRSHELSDRCGYAE